MLFDSFLASGIDVSLSTALCRRGGWKGWLRYILDPFELLIWALWNKVPFYKIGFVFFKNSLKKYDALFFMHYGNFTYEDLENARRGVRFAEALSNIDILKIGHLTHYAYHPAIGSKNLDKLGVSLLVAENNLSKNSGFYKKYFDNLNAEFWCLPFIAAKKFQNHTPFKNRKCKLVATGSVTYKMTDDNFKDFFRTDELQPLRRKIYEYAKVSKIEIDSIISDLNSSREAFYDKGIKTWKSSLFRFLLHPQDAYFKKNIVEIYNSYMMFTATEEICDLPAIGVVEGMACGSVFFGLESPMYRDLGMVPGIHYVAHDGTLDNLLEKIRFYQQPSQLYELEQIAQRGYKLANEKFRAEIIYPKFIKRLTDFIRSEKT